MTRKARFTVPVACLVAFMVACNADTPTTPTNGGRLTPGVATADNSPGSNREDTVAVLKRLVPLVSEVSASAVIGPMGGEIRLNATGAKIEFPAGALSAPTLITMTARAGTDVAYEFSPHGITFAAPVKIQQDLRGTWAALDLALTDRIGGAYYDTDLGQSFVDLGKKYVKVRETRPGSVDVSTRQARFYVTHFSGYLFSSGRMADLDDR